jgi:peptidoglycan-associated lipoprotein
MIYYRSIAFCWIAVSAALALAGCSSTTAKPDMASTDSAKPQAEAKAKASAMDRDSASSSSLEALKRGESTATPSSSPLKEVYFGFDRYDLGADAREILKANAGWLKSNGSARIEIEGHADERGTSEYNLALGAKRAQAAKDYLVTLGISGERLSTISYGEEIPVCREQNEGCWQKNRRDRFVIQPTPPTN